MQVTHYDKERIFILFPPQLKTNLWMISRLPGSLDHYSAPRYSDVTMSAMASQITGVLIAYSTVCSKKTSKLRVTGLCEGNSPMTGEFPAATDEFPAKKKQ